MSRKTLLVLTSTFPRWAQDTLPTFVCDLTARLAPHYDVIVAAPHAKGSQPHEIMMGIEVIRYRYFFDWGETLAYNSGIIANLKRNPFNYLLILPLLLSQLCAVIHLLRNRKIDIIHAHWSFPQGIIATLAIMLTRSNAKLVCTLHGSDLHFRKNIFRMMHRFVFKKSTAITVVSHSLCDLAVEIGAEPSKLTVIPMGLNAQKTFTLDGVTQQRANLLFVGRLIKSKGVSILLKAMAIITQTYPEQKLIIVGDGVERETLESLVKLLHISNNVMFAGAKPHNQLPDFYKQASIFVSPTLSEGFGLTLAEALACGCAVVVSDLPAVQDIIENQKTGLVFEVGNVEALAQCIVNLLSDEALRNMLANQGREKVLMNFDWDIISDRYCLFFNKLLKI